MGLDGKITLVGEKWVACSIESLVLIGQQAGRVDFLIVDTMLQIEHFHHDESHVGMCFVCANAVPPLIDCDELLVAQAWGRAKTHWGPSKNYSSTSCAVRPQMSV